MNKIISILLLSLAVLTMASCGEDSGIPASSSKPYEVLLDGDRGNILYKELTDTVEGLPQSEPSFDVIFAKDSTQAPWQRLTRNIVYVVFNAKADSVTVTTQKNVYAKPQMVLTVTAPSVERLKEYVRIHPGAIRSELERFELVSRIKVLKAQHNEKARNMLLKEFGIDMLIPSDMQSSKQGKDFIWLSNNANEGLTNICVYKVKAGKADFRQVRDSVMKVNIPGERDGMYMETAKCWKSRGELYRGLWDMHGDAMGGPFIARIISHPPYIIYVEGFVYAPEGKKRNKIRLLEAVLLSAKYIGNYNQLMKIHNYQNTIYGRK